MGWADEWERRERTRDARATPLLRLPEGRTHVLDLPGGVVLGVDSRARYPVAELRI
ncbi:hypothetical protein SNL152K_689 [Streptomyces sp. NL15-2K]|nr:hypothetical protein [Kutzneria buriramensis]WKX06404.1 hypothetical protein Q4V64_02425 [Kutzneria buriramensis]GCB43404.1 hypothetical protein SNL152K_689 [Streptomyces sp. NL15-2K]